MSDSYQAIYDAVRSRISNANIGDAVESAMRSANISHYFEMMMRRGQETAASYDRPSAIYRPTLTVDGNQYCALYGADLVDGVAGFGPSAADAMAAFDAAWYAKLRSPKDPAHD